MKYIRPLWERYRQWRFVRLIMAISKHFPHNDKIRIAVDPKTNDVKGIMIGTVPLTPGHDVPLDIQGEA